MKKTVLMIVSLFIFFPALAVQPIKIEIGQNYDGYSNEELRRRVWQLERAVAQLQDQVFQLAINNKKNEVITEKPVWTCRIKSFSKVIVSSGSTRAGAMADVLKKCSEATNAIHCNESDVSCDKE